MRIHLLQHMLTSYFGHWFNETLGWMAAARQAGIDLRVYGARDMTAEALAQTGARGVYGMTQDIAARFGVPSRYARKPEPHCQPLIDFMAWSEAFRLACHAVAEAGIAEDELLAVPFATIYEVHGTALWLDAVPAARRPSVLFHFHEPHHTWRIEPDRDRAKADFSLSRYAGRRLQALLPPQRVILTAHDPRLCALLQQALLVPCHLAPVMMHYGASEPAGAPGAGKGRPLLISMPGDFRKERGGLEVIEAFCALAERKREVRFLVQVRAEKEAIALRERFRRAASPARLEIQVGPTPQEQYLDQLTRSDIVFLPYRWERYAIRASGVFSEAVAYGLPVVVPANTWMADQLAAGRGAGETFAERTPGAMADALARAVERITELQESARLRSADWRRHQSIQSYLSRVVGLWHARPA